MNNSLTRDIQTYIVENGNAIDKLRLVAAAYELPSSIKEESLKQIEMVQNEDGGLPFDLVRGNPSSVKLTSEVIPLIVKFKDSYSEVIDRMVSFIVSRQKQDGGFGEALNLDSYIADKYGITDGRDWYPVGKSITWLTGKCLEALVLAKHNDQERIRRARDYLLYSQNEDGHWPDFKGHEESDPLGTGNILPALLAAGVSEEHKVYIDARAALLQHLIDAIDNESTYDMVDLSAVGKPTNDKEKDLIMRGLNLIMISQNTDGGWAPIGSKKSDPELSSILAFVASVCSRY